MTTIEFNEKELQSLRVAIQCYCSQWISQSTEPLRAGEQDDADLFYSLYQQSSELREKLQAAGN